MQDTYECTTNTRYKYVCTYTHITHTYAHTYKHPCLHTHVPTYAHTHTIRIHTFTHASKINQKKMPLPLQHPAFAHGCSAHLLLPMGRYFRRCDSVPVTCTLSIITSPPSSIAAAVVSGCLCLLWRGSSCYDTSFFLVGLGAAK
jgi:hypothetical protein